LAQTTNVIAEDNYQRLVGITTRPVPSVTVDFFLLGAGGIRHPFTDRFWLDTGFDADLKESAQFGQSLIKLGLYAANKTIGTAAAPAAAKLFHAEVTGVKGRAAYKFPSPIPVGLHCSGLMGTAPLLGLGLMNRWLTTFDGPAQFLKIIG
jgi:hypothetical protein